MMLWRTPLEHGSVVDEMQAAEGKDGVCPSRSHRTWGDVPDASAKMLVVTDD